MNGYDGVAVLTGTGTAAGTGTAPPGADRPRVLFVDDDPQMVAGLRRMLRSHRDAWDMTFAESAAQALAILATGPYDAVVSDYRMPGMDGGALLEVIRGRYPYTARLILSGHTNEDDLIKVVLLAHQFIPKPCRPDELLGALERVLGPRRELARRDLRRELVGIDTLPSVPHTLIELLALLEPPDASPSGVAEVLVRDPAATAKVLHVVNSAGAGTRHRISNVAQAVTLLGMRNVRALVLLYDLVHDFNRTRTIPSDWVARLTRHCVQTSRLARALSAGTGWAEEAFTAGLLLEIGQLVVAACRPRQFEVHQHTWAGTGGALRPLELLTFGTDHAAIGAHLLGLWGLPADIGEAVAAHTTAVPPGRPADLAGTVALAHALAEAHCGALCGRYDGVPAVADSQLDPDVLDRVALWRAACPTGPDLREEQP